MKHIFFINENANNGKNKLLRDQLRTICKEEVLDFHIFEGATEEEKKEIIERYKNEYATIYAVGGDGTVNSTLNEIIGGRASLGILPMGSGNDFYRKLDEYPESVIDVNVMKVNEKYGLNIFSLGIDAEICANAEKMKQLGISASYIYKLGMLYTFFKHRDEFIGINGYYQKMLLLAVCNGSYYGGGFRLAPNADIRDSKALVYMMDHVSKPQMLWFLIELVLGKHENNKYLDIFEAEGELHIETFKPLVAQIDGELIVDTDFRVNPSASTIRVINERELIRKLKK